MVLVKCSHCGRESDQNQQEREIRSRDKRGCPDCGQSGTERLVIREERELGPAEEANYWAKQQIRTITKGSVIPNPSKEPEVPHGIRVGPGGTVQNKPKKKDGSS